MGGAPITGTVTEAVVTASGTKDRPGSTQYPGTGNLVSASPGFRIAVLGARGVGKTTVAALLGALLLRRGLPVTIPSTAHSPGRRSPDKSGPSVTAGLPCFSAVDIVDVDLWEDAVGLLAGDVDTVVVVATGDLVSMEYAVLATRLAQYPTAGVADLTGSSLHPMGIGRHRVGRTAHLVVNRMQTDADIERALRNLDRADPSNGSEYRSIHTLPEEPAALPSDTNGWYEVLAQTEPLRHSALVNAIGWLANDLLPAPAATLG
jgi:hypothetical protein